MTEHLGGVPLGRGGEWRRESEVPGIGMLSEAIIRTHGVEHCNEHTGDTFYDYRWEDPDVYGKYYWLEQTSLPGANNVHNYSLQVYTEGDEGSEVAEWYRFQTYDAHATPCDTDGRIVPTTYHQMLEGGRRARNYLRLAMAGVSIPLTPLAPPDRLPMEVELTDAENDEFIHMAGCYALEVPGGPNLVLKRIYNLPPSGITGRDAEKLANSCVSADHCRVDTIRGPRRFRFCNYPQSGFRAPCSAPYMIANQASSRSTYRPENNCSHIRLLRL